MRALFQLFKYTFFFYTHFIYLLKIKKILTCQLHSHSFKMTKILKKARGFLNYLSTHF